MILPEHFVSSCCPWRKFLLRSLSITTSFPLLICRIKYKNVAVNFPVVQNYFQSQIDKNQGNCTFLSLLYCSFVFLAFVSVLLDRVLDAVLQWRFSFFPVVVLYLLLFSFVSALPAKIASCKNVMKCDVCTYGARAHKPFRLP